MYSTRGKALGAEARAFAVYYGSVGSVSITYPTAVKDVLASGMHYPFSVGYFLDGGVPTVGFLRLTATAKGFRPIPGGPAMFKLVVDEQSFGPYPSADTDVRYGSYFVQIQSREIKEDSGPSVVRLDDFAPLARAVDQAASVEVFIVQDGTEIARMPVTVSRRVEFRDGLAPWAAQIARSLGSATPCGGDRVVN